MYRLCSPFRLLYRGQKELTLTPVPTSIGTGVNLFPVALFNENSLQHFFAWQLIRRSELLTC